MIRTKFNRLPFTIHDVHEYQLWRAEKIDELKRLPIRLRIHRAKLFYHIESRWLLKHPSIVLNRKHFAHIQVESEKELVRTEGLQALETFKKDNEIQ